MNMSIKIYNTLTRKKEDFVPLEHGKVKMYVCGPTVYNHIHIGNARPAIFFDVVRRYLQYRGYDVRFVQNFTDVDDKIIKVALEEGVKASDISERYIDSYLQMAEQLSVKEADLHPKVTENISEIIDFIQQLIENNLAYESNGDVYYRTKKFAEYGKLSHQKTDELLEGVRIDVGENKESPLDFTLWKKSKPGEVAWDSPWGEGRPGWHIECSAMIKKYLGDTIDIHGGGIDLSFPHHENEIAQSESLTGQQLAKYWMHNAMLTINDQKMSKSLGNFIRVNDVLAHHDSQVVRFFMLSGHYRTPLNYSDELLHNAGNGLQRLKTTVANIKHALSSLQNKSVNDKETHKGDKEAPAGNERGHSDHEAREKQEAIVKWRQKFEAAMDDDFNTANAISALFELSKEANSQLSNNQLSEETMKAYLNTLTDLAHILGLTLDEQVELLDDDIDQLIEERQQARQAKDFARADEIRDLLQEKGIILEDTPQGVRWKRK